MSGRFQTGRALFPASFDPVTSGEVVADDHNGAITTSSAGRILMPLYRPPCEDGFMVVTELDGWPAD